MQSRRYNWSKQKNADPPPKLDDLEKRFNIYSAKPQESTGLKIGDLESRFKIYTPKETVESRHLENEDELENRFKMHLPRYDGNEEFNSGQQNTNLPDIYQIDYDVTQNHSSSNDFNEHFNSGNLYAPEEYQMQYHPDVTTATLGNSDFLSDDWKKQDIYEDIEVNPSPGYQFATREYDEIKRRNIPFVRNYPDQTSNMSYNKQEESKVDNLRELIEPLFKKREIKYEFEIKSSGKNRYKKRNNITRVVGNIKSAYQNFALFKKTLKNVEIKFGTSAAVYLLFIQWLMFLNLFIFILLLAFVILPSLLYVEENSVTCSPDNSTSACCASQYFNKTEDFYFLDIFQGTGILERTHLFYGKYSDKSIDYIANNNDKQYKLSVAYLGITVSYFVFSLILIIRGSTKSFKENITDVNKSNFGNMIFGSWNFSIDNEKDEIEKKNTILHDITTTLKNKISEEERVRNIEEHITKIRIIRVLANFFVIALLVGAAVAIYFVFNLSMNTLDDGSLYSNDDSFNEFMKIVLQFLPSITIVFLNLAIPLIFQVLISFENYSPSFSITFTLIRMVFLRMFSLCVFYASLHGKILCKATDKQCTAPHCPTCWETYAGQQIYKLAITDFIINIVTTFVIGGLRILASKVTSFINKPMFDLPKHTLDIIYLQTICWVGSFYVPFLPAIFVIIFFIMFHVKVLVCLKMSQPSVQSYNSSRSNAMFMIVLLIGLIFALLPIVYSIGILQPSKSCGPFRDYFVVWDAISTSLNDAPNWLATIIYFIGTEGFAIPMLVLFCLIIYYYVAVLATNKHIIQDLKDQLSQDNEKQILRQIILTHEKSQ